MRHSPRLPSPSTWIASLALFFALGGSALAVGNHLLGGAGALTAQRRCAAGAVKGVAVIGIPSALRSEFSGFGRAFVRRFNCAGRGVQARKIGTGTFDVRFPGIRVQTVIGGVLSLNGGSLTTVAQADGSVRVTVRSASSQENVLLPFDLPFAVVVF